MSKNNQLLVILISILAFAFVLTPASATHSVNVSATPYWSMANLSSYQITFKVQNLQSSNNTIITVQIDNLPNQTYLISSLKCPNGWTNAVFDMDSDGQNDTILCNTTDAFAIKAGKYVNIVLNVSVSTEDPDSVVQHGWNYQTNDTAGDTQTGVVSTAVDNSAPTKPNLRAPSNNSVITGKNILFNWSASSDLGSGVASYVLEISNSSDFSVVLLSAQATGTTYNSSYNFYEGTFYWHVRARDIAGNSGIFSDAREFNIDKTAPEISEVTVSNATISFGSTIQITASNVTDSTNVSEVTAQIKLPDGNTTNRTMDSVGGDEYTADFKPSSPGVYYIYVEASDIVGNSNKTVNATVLRVVGQTTNERFWDVIQPDVVVIADQFSVSGLDEVNIRVNSAVNDVLLKATEFSTKPSGTSVLKDTYSYFGITLSSISSSYLNSAVIKFSVPKSWLTDNNFDADSISLYRYNSGSWQQLTTTKLSETSSEAKYSADTPGFSFFAIASSGARAPAQNQTENQTANQTAINQTVNQTTTNVTTNQTNQTNQTTTPSILIQVPGNFVITIGIILAIIVIAFMIYYFIYRRRNSLMYKPF